MAEEGMKEERLKILEMISDGKITAKEGAVLISSLNDTNLKWNYDFDFAEEKCNRFSANVEQFAKEMSGKAKDFEPKVKEVTKNILSKTAQILDEAAKTLNVKATSFKEEFTQTATEDENEEGKSN
jgi:predicted P-loop ATPase/GTPase